VRHFRLPACPVSGSSQPRIITSAAKVQSPRESVGAGNVYLSQNSEGAQAVGEVVANAVKGDRYPAEDCTCDPFSLCSESRVY
jgi:hypothetical protein